MVSYLDMANAIMRGSYGPRLIFHSFMNVECPTEHWPRPTCGTLYAKTKLNQSKNLVESLIDSALF